MREVGCAFMAASTPPSDWILDMLCSAASMVCSKRNSCCLMGGRVVDRIHFMAGRNHAGVPGGFED